MYLHLGIAIYSWDIFYEFFVQMEVGRYSYLVGFCRAVVFQLHYFWNLWKLGL